MEEAEEKVFLSAATLLVVPANLVQHWVSQVQSHVRFNTLRILVISSDKDRSNKMPPPQCLAWNYDLVSLSEKDFKTSTKLLYTLQAPLSTAA